jgi:ribonucleoside-diphosphate reductase alpha chain
MNQTYSHDELYASTLEYFKGDELATKVWIDKYALKIKGEYTELNPDDMIKRLTNEIKRTEDKHPNPLSYDKIYSILKNFNQFIFGGSVLFGAGNPNAISLSNCFFIDNQADSYGGIFNLDESIAQLMKRRGGVGITIEHLRPKFSPVNNSAQTSTGGISFMSRFSNTTREVAQDGRRGALMISCHCQYPDIMDFISAKDDLGQITGANVSVKVTDEFMNAVKEDQDYYLCWPIQKTQPVVEEQMPYNKTKILEDGKYVKRVKAREVWEAIIKMAHKNAEPGVLFWDNIINESPADMYAADGFETKGTNPCGEIPLSSHDACRLGSLNLTAFVDKPFTSKARMKWTELGEISRVAQRFMDDVAILEEDKIKKIIKKIKSDPEDKDIKKNELDLWNKILVALRKGRRTGLGFLGLADTLAALGLTFGTKEATKMAEKITKTMTIASYKESITLAKERGAFDIWDADKEAGNPFLTRVISNNFSTEEYDDYLAYGRRNIANTTCAPTGSLSILGQVSSGLEPVFKCFFYRVKKVNANIEGVKIDFVDQNGDSWEEFFVLHKPFENWINKYKPEIEINTLSEDELNELVAESPWAGSESHSIDYKEKVNMQGAIQKWIDHSLSVTHNLPENISIEAVNDIYFQAWKAGCKGCTIYREGSRTGVLSTTKKNSEDEFIETTSPKRPKELVADYYAASAKGHKFAVIIGLYKNKPYEMFAFENPPFEKNTRGKIIKIRKGHYRFINGEFEIDNLELASDRIEERSLTLTISAMLRHGVKIDYINKIVQKVDQNISSFSSVIRRYLSRYTDSYEVDGDACPECGSKLITESGCVRCGSCGYNKCT